MKDLIARISALSSSPEVRIRSMRAIDVVWGQLVVAVTTFAGVRIYTELLTQAEFGLAVLAMGGIALLDGLMGMALNQTLLARCAQIQDEELRRQISVGLTFLVSLIAIALGAIATLALLIASAFQIAPAYWTIYPAALLIYCCAEFSKYSLLSLITIDRSYRKISIWYAGEAIFALIIIAILLHFWRGDSIGYITGYIASRLTSCVIFIKLFSKGHFSNVDLKHARREARSASRYGAPVALMAPLGWMSSYLDRYILGAMLGVSATGAYAAATGLVTRPYALTTNVLSNYFRPQLYRPPETTGAGDRSWQRSIMYSWAILALLIGGCGALAFLFLGTPIIRIFLAHDYRSGAIPLIVTFAIAQTLVIVTHSADNVLLAMGRSSALLKLQLALSLGTLILVPAGVYMGGALGAIAGRCLAEILKLFATMSLARHFSRNTLDEYRSDKANVQSENII